MIRSCTLDIESNSLLSNSLDYSSFPYKLNSEAKLWVVVVQDVETGEVFSATEENITREWLDKVLEPYYYIIFHNGIKFDLISLHLFGLIDYRIGYIDELDTLNGRDVRFIDTLILSRLSNPDRFGGHSLEAWGKRTENFKTDYREQCIERGYIEKGSPKGEEFKAYNDLMLPYCIQDCSATASTYKALLEELSDYDGWKRAIRMEHKLADLAIRRETFGFFFNKELALKCLDELTIIMQELTDKVNPILPTRKLNKGEIDFYTPPKNQFKADGSFTQSFLRFVERVKGGIVDDKFAFEGKFYDLPLTEPLKTEVQATIDDLDTVKQHLLNIRAVSEEFEHLYEDVEWVNE